MELTQPCHVFLTEAEIDELFQEKELNVEETEITKKVSKLSQLLQDSLNQPSNPFIDYAKFDGEVRRPITIDYFLYFLILNCWE